MPTTAHTFNPPTQADTQAHTPTVTTAGGDADAGTAYINVSITAANQAEAEKHALAFIDFHYDDDLNGATATATNTGVRSNGAQAWTVHITLARPATRTPATGHYRLSYR